MENFSSNCWLRKIFYLASAAIQHPEAKPGETEGPIRLVNLTGQLQRSCRPEAERSGRPTYRWKHL